MQLREAELTKVRAKSIGFIFQTFNLIPTPTAQENVETALVPLHVPAAGRHARAATALADVGLVIGPGTCPASCPADSSSASPPPALVKEPEVLLADESSGNLDEDTRDELTALLDRLWRHLGLTLVAVTHDSAVASRPATGPAIQRPRVHHMKAGNVPRRPSAPRHSL